MEFFTLTSSSKLITILHYYSNIIFVQRVITGYTFPGIIRHLQWKPHSRDVLANHIMHVGNGSRATIALKSILNEYIIKKCNFLACPFRPFFTSLVITSIKKYHIIIII